MKNIKRIITVLFVGLTLNASAQQDAQFTQYFDNTLFVNSAYAGSGGMLNATAIHREQWVGIDGRPRSTTFSMNSPLSYENLGVGFTVVNDIIGPINQTSLNADLSYTLNFKNSEGKLSFGLKGGLNIFNSRANELSTTSANDPNLLGSSRNELLPNFGAGIYYHTPKFFIGLSVPKFVESKISETSSANEKRHYFFIAGGVMKISEQWKLRPTTQLKYAIGVPLSIDLSVAGIYREKLWLGIMHRWGDSFGTFVQYQISPQFKAGLAYDYTITELSSYNAGTFEVLLSYDFVFNKKGIRSPRYF